PAAAPTPSDRAEGADDGRGHHAWPVLRAVEVGTASRVAALTAADVGILDRVQVDRLTESMLRPRARAASTDARRGHRLPTFEAGADVGVCRAPPYWPVRVGEAHVADREVERVELAEDQGERRGC